MGDVYPPAKQREALLELVEALGCRDACLRRDECGDWRINGKLGHVYAAPGGFQLVFRGAPLDEEPLPGSRAWGFARTALAFCEVTQDGDGEGTLFLDRLPTGAEAEVIRDKFGIAKKREMSEADLDRLKGMGRRFERRPSDIVDGDRSEKPASANEAEAMEPMTPAEAK